MRQTLYKENLKTFYVDEKYNFKGTYIDGFYHGVCIDFSLLLKNKYKEIGLETFLVATRTAEGNHGALLYEINNELYIVDPITDARILTQNNMSELEREEFVNNEKLNIDIPLEEYIINNGTISVFEDDFSTIITSDKVEEIKKGIRPEEQKNRKK